MIEVAYTVQGGSEVALSVGVIEVYFCIEAERCSLDLSDSTLFEDLRW